MPMNAAAMNSMKESNYYETTDLAFASFLVASGHASLVDIRENEQLKKTFVLSPSPSQQIIMGFYNGSEKVSAIRLLESYQTLKSATYLVKSNGSNKLTINNGGK